MEMFDRCGEVIIDVDFRVAEDVDPKNKQFKVTSRRIDFKNVTKKFLLKVFG